MSIYVPAVRPQGDCLAGDPTDDDPSLDERKAASLATVFELSPELLGDVFLAPYGLDYIANLCLRMKWDFRIVTHPYATNTCYEKALVLGAFNPLNVIKALYFECTHDDSLIVVTVPETGCFVDRAKLTTSLGLAEGVTLAKAKKLPSHMTYGTCSPFLAPSDPISRGGRVRAVYFDTETLVMKKAENEFDDFSFGANHRQSIQLNYYHCFRLLKMVFGTIVQSTDLLPLSFKERFVRKNGRVRVVYEFDSLNYRTARFINDIHGYGDVTFENDHSNELDLPDVLTSQLT